MNLGYSDVAHIHTDERQERHARPSIRLFNKTGDSVKASYLSPLLLKAQLVSGRIWALRILKR